MDNREIKFRAWDLLELKMIGCETIFSIAPDGSFIQYAEHGFLHNNLNSPESHKEYLTKNGIEIRDEFVLMQFTGLHDKNGKEVYEHDYNQHGEVVVFCNECNGWQFALYDFPTKEFIFCHNCEGNFMFQDGISEMKIIGNVYENPTPSI